MSMASHSQAFLVRFASRPVLSGFTMGSVILTIASVAKDILGVKIARSQVIYTYILDIATALPNTRIPTLITSIVALVLLISLPHIPYAKKVPASLPVRACACYGLLSMTSQACHVSGRRSSGCRIRHVALADECPCSWRWRLSAWRRHDKPRRRRPRGLRSIVDPRSSNTEPGAIVSDPDVCDCIWYNSCRFC